jgi:hypothetical protein
VPALMSNRDVAVGLMGDFSVVLFRPNLMLASEENLMKVHKNQCLLIPSILLISLVEPRTKAQPMVSEVQTPSQ